jgi:hypothetical protein
MQIVKLDDPGYTGPVKEGDDVWFKLSDGDGRKSWHEGGILGVHVSQGANLSTINILNDSIYDGGESKDFIGYPAPLPAFVTDSFSLRENISDKELVYRNRKNIMLGKWKIKWALKSAQMSLVRKLDDNTDRKGSKTVAIEVQK